MPSLLPLKKSSPIVKSHAKVTHIGGESHRILTHPEEALTWRSALLDRGVGDVDSGNDWKGSPGESGWGEVDQVDCKNDEHVAEQGSEGAAFGGDGASVQARGARSKPKLGGYVAALEEMLEANEKKAGKDRLTVKRMWLDLAGRGCGAGYNVVCRHAAQRRRGRGTGTGGAYVPLEFDPGEAYRFDWSQEHVVIAGATTKLKVAHLRLCHSRMSLRLSGITCVRAIR